MAALETVSMPAALKTFLASVAAALFRIAITPIDTIKTMLQVRGADGLGLLAERVAADGAVGALYAGCLASSLATLLGHYPWFLVFNTLQARVPRPQHRGGALLRSALIGFCASATSDTISNSVRVVKTAAQTSTKPGLGLYGAALDIVSAEGLHGLFFRGLGTKILSNGLQAMLFTICWKYFEEKLAARQTRADKAAAKIRTYSGTAQKKAA